jgi:hypothetical protein
MIQPLVLPPTHGNQLWAYEIPEAGRNLPPVQRKGPGMKRIRSPHWAEGKMQTYKHVTLFPVARIGKEMEAALQENKEERLLVAK